MSCASGVMKTSEAGICYKDPCQNIARAVVGSCQSIGDTDFTCRCQQNYAWNDDSNSCDIHADRDVTGSRNLICEKDPCQNIARAIVSSCEPVGAADFQCQCQDVFHWDDDSNSCNPSAG